MTYGMDASETSTAEPSPLVDRSQRFLRSGPIGRGNGVAPSLTRGGRPRRPGRPRSGRAARRSGSTSTTRRRGTRCGRTPSGSRTVDGSSRNRSSRSREPTSHWTTSNTGSSDGRSGSTGSDTFRTRFRRRSSAGIASPTLIPGSTSRSTAARPPVPPSPPTPPTRSTSSSTGPPRAT